MTSRGLLSCVLALAPAVTSQGDQVDLVDQDALRAAVSRFAESVDQDHVLGAVLMVTQGDRVLVHEALGHRDVARRYQGQPRSRVECTASLGSLFLRMKLVCYYAT